MSQYFNQVSYGLSQALINQPPFPIYAKRAPTTHDIGYALGTLWVFVESNEAYILTSVVNNTATWLQVEASGGAGVFSSLTVTPGPISLTGTTTINTTGAGVTTIGTGGTGAVNIGNATGNTAVTGSLTASVNITATTGNIVASSGSIEAGTDLIATAGVAEAVSLVATGDIGSGIEDETIFTNATQAASGTGDLTILSASGSTARTNAGFIKIYVGTDVAYVPYYTQID
ncbi:MAG TPA: hypothetical protein VHA52_02270 [Candidatus Babeliaceae bacterium]|nr:hypothetical protein [Candidatus Babeliaceae bacterium]